MSSRPSKSAASSATTSAAAAFPASLQRRATDAVFLGPRVHNLAPPTEKSQEQLGWVAATLGRTLPDDASAEFRSGFREGEAHGDSIRTASECYAVLQS